MNLDMTFCASPQCKGECGRQLTDEVKQAAKRIGKPWLSMRYFCGEPEIEEKELGGEE